MVGDTSGRRVPNTTKFICYGKFCPHFKTKKSNNIQIFANPTGLAILPCYGRSTPTDFESHPQFSLAESKRPSWQHEPVRGRDNRTHQGTHRQFALRQGKSHPPMYFKNILIYIRAVNEIRVVLCWKIYEVHILLLTFFKVILLVWIQINLYTLYQRENQNNIN